MSFNTGRSPKADIYRRREMRQREIAVTLLADMSTSIMQHLPEGGGRLPGRLARRRGPLASGMVPKLPHVAAISGSVCQTALA